MRSARPARPAASREGIEMSEESGNGTVRPTTPKAAEPEAPKPVRTRRSATAKAAAKAPAALSPETQSIAVEPKPASTPHAIVVPEPRGGRVEATTVNITQGGAGEVEPESVTVAKGAAKAPAALSPETQSIAVEPK